ncbi:5-formyltetrahydrofolate cyclo-ligase [Reyranella sp.]|uniref:5-formyltetrahydrofolate cyclo-ligase n=1 Tax=Reyranella sp. TaxID=1929291 RepID=UPI003F72EFBF
MIAHDNDAGRDGPDDDYGSPACMIHLVDPASGALSDQDPRQQQDLKRWRTVERERLVALRLAIPAEERRGLSDRIARELDRLLGDLSGKTVAAYLPFRGEPDLRFWIEGLSMRGAIAALPVVVAPRSPLEFRTWSRGEPLRPGVWNIPVPAGGTVVTPDVVIAPVVGYDAACYRLGHGGGYYDRTLAALPRRPRIVGVGYERLALRTIYPQTYDVPMDAIVTEAGVSTR